MLLLSVQGCATSPSWQTVGGAPWLLQSGEWSPDTTGQASMLVSDKTYADFYLSVEFFPDEAVNSGVFFRCQDPDDITPFNCFEANIWDRHPDQANRTGAVVEVFKPPMVQVATIGRWNQMEITAVGRTLTVTVNGELTASFDSDSFREGHLALQWGGAGNIRFRGLDVSVL